MEKEQFNPHDYKSYEELPEDKKGDFEKVEEGGFVKKEAAQHFEELKEEAREYNKGKDRRVFYTEEAIKENQEFHRNFFQRIAGLSKAEATDIALKKAQKIDYIEMANVKIDKIKKSMPEELKEKLEKVIFSVREEASYFEKVYEYKVTGLEDAIKVAVGAGASFNYDTDFAVTDAKYEDSDTQVKIVGISNGWGYARPRVSIKHKGQEYSWVEVF